MTHERYHGSKVQSSKANMPKSSATSNFSSCLSMQCSVFTSSLHAPIIIVKAAAIQRQPSGNQPMHRPRHHVTYENMEKTGAQGLGHSLAVVYQSKNNGNLMKSPTEVWVATSTEDQ